MTQIEALERLKTDSHPPLGWFIQYRNGATSFVYTDPIQWPASVIRQVSYIRKMTKPAESTCNCINCTDGEAA